MDRHAGKETDNNLKPIGRTRKAAKADLPKTGYRSGAARANSYMA
jgi:hypothetical protein